MKFGVSLPLPNLRDTLKRLHPVNLKDEPEAVILFANESNNLQKFVEECIRRKNTP
jgi:hypothetical protein